ncbi:MAG: hypothetical protein U0U66_03665 [Cytophagaceae bacterium]
MKKVISILVIMIYTFSGIGIPVYSHFCGDKLASISLFGEGGTTKKCNQCGKKSTKDCCKDTRQVLSIDDSNSGKFLKIDLPKFSDFIAFGLNNNISVDGEFYWVAIHSDSFYVYETGPPKTPIYIYIHSLLI